MADPIKLSQEEECELRLECLRLALAACAGHDPGGMRVAPAAIVWTARLFEDYVRNGAGPAAGGAQC